MEHFPCTLEMDETERKLVRQGLRIYQAKCRNLASEEFRNAHEAESGVIAELYLQLGRQWTKNAHAASELLLRV